MTKAFKGIYIKVSPDIHDKIDDLGINKTECFLRGLETYYDEVELKKLAEKHQNEYIRVYTMLENKLKRKQAQPSKIETEIKNSFNPEFYIGKEIDGIKVTKAIVDRIIQEKQSESLAKKEVDYDAK